MQINYSVIVVLAIVVIALVIFIIRKNLKDKKTLETFLDHDFNKNDNDLGDNDENNRNGVS